MKKVIFMVAIATLSCLMAFAQNSGKGFNYQAVARDIYGQVLQNQLVELRFSLIPGQYAPPAWEETQEATTDVFGAFSLTVGKGVSTGGGTLNTYDELDFAAADYWLKVELKDGDEFFEISFRELMTVPYAEVARNAIPNPPGTILAFAGPLENIPDGYLPCDGSLVDNEAYPLLYAAIGNSWGGDVTHFNLPDCRGMFLRGVDHGADNDPDAADRTSSNTGGNTGDNVGSVQDDEFGEHNHDGSTSTDGLHNHDNGEFKQLLRYTGTYTADSYDNNPGEVDIIHYGEILPAGDHSHTISPSGGNETRPINVYVNYIIKY
jgi:microcystin-dependent protein